MAHGTTARAETAERAETTERAETKRDETTAARSPLRTWLVVALVLGSLVGIPALVLGETEFGLLTALGLPRELTLGALALLPGFALGGLSLVVMTGWEAPGRRT